MPSPPPWSSLQDPEGENSELAFASLRGEEEQEGGKEGRKEREASEERSGEGIWEEVQSAYELRRGEEAPVSVLVRQIPGQGLSFQLWPAATALSQYLERNELSLKLRGARVVELGAGTGLAGTVAACLGAQTVLTDLPHVLPNLEHTVELNRVAVERGGGALSAKVLRWGIDEDAASFSQQVDIILGADIVYYDTLFQPLLQTLQCLLPRQTNSTSTLHVTGMARQGENDNLTEMLEDVNVCDTRTAQSMQVDSPVVLLAHLRRWKKDSKFFRAVARDFSVSLVHQDDPENGARKGVEVYRLIRRSR